MLDSGSFDEWHSVSQRKNLPHHSAGTEDLPIGYRVPRVLFVAANPDEPTRLRLSQEYREVKEAFNRTRSDFQLDHQPALRNLDLSRALQEFKPNFVHFSGHGTRRGLVIEDDHGKSRLVGADVLARLFARHSDTVVCVMLNACYSESQATAISQHIPYVIGMKAALPDQATLKFSVAFYDSIAAGESIESAFENGKSVLGLELNEPTPGATLVLKRDLGLEDVFNKKEAVPKTNWGEAPRVSQLYGRDEELSTLRKWILDDRCSLILVVGIGGVGKSRLSVKLGRGGVGKTKLSRQCAGALENHFEFVIWQRLLNAPPPTQIVTECIRFILGEGEYTLPRSFEGLASTLMALLQNHRCLLVLDNIEAVLEGGHDSVRYRGGFEGYGELLRTVGEMEHKSCVLLTSREKPPEVARMEGPTRPVRTLSLGGLRTQYGRQVVGDLGTFEASDQDWEDLVTLYNGNPLALELAAHHVRDAHTGNIRAFLGSDRPIFGDLRELLDWHLGRLSSKEKEVMYWLAIEREAVSISQLTEDLLHPTSREELPTTIQSLQRRLPIERQGSDFSLQPVLMEYMTESLVQRVGEEVQVGDSRVLDHFTERFVDEVCDEIARSRFDLLNAHALLKADSKDYVRASQSRVIVQPLIDRLLAQYGHQQALETVLFSIVEGLRRASPHQPGYMVGNILGLFSELGTDLTGADFSHCVIWQAYLQSVKLHDVDFTSSKFWNVRFRSDFAQLLSVACSPDGNFVAIGDTLNVLQVLSLPDLKPISNCLGHEGWVSCAAFSVAGDTLVSGGYDHIGRLWDLKTGACRGVFKGHKNWITTLALSPNGGLLATGSEDGEVHLWNVETTKSMRTLVQIDEGWIGAVAFDPEERWVASIGSDGVLRLTGLDDSTEELSLRLNGTYRSMSFFPDGRQLALGGEKIICVNIPELKVSRTIEAHPNGTWCIAISPDGRWLASAGNERLIRLWHAASGEFVRSMEGHEARVYSLAFHPNAKSLISVSADQTVRLWDADRGTPTRTLRGYANVLWCTIYLPDGERIATVGDDGVPRIWYEAETICQARLGQGSDRLWTVATDPEGKLIAAAGDDLVVRIWRLRDGLCIQSCGGHTGWVRGLDFHPGGSLLASGAEDCLVKLWDPVTGACRATLDGQGDRVLSVAFSMNGRYLASGGEDCMILIWDIDKEEYVDYLVGHRDKVHQVAFSPDSQQLASCSEDCRIRVWDLEQSQCIATLEAHRSKIWTVAYSPRGDLLCSGGEDGVIMIWDAKTLKLVGNLRGHETRIWSLSIAPDGKRLASTSDDGTLRIWDLESRTQQRVLRPRRPYEGMCLSKVEGLEASEILMLERLGAHT